MTWEYDPAHSEVGFSVKHMMISTVRGRFSDVQASVDLDPAQLGNARVRGEIGVASVNTNDAQRDAHLKSADFFDAEKYPKIVFESTSIERTGERVKVTGNLTIRDKTNPVTLEGSFDGPSKDPWGNQRVGFSLRGEIEREAFGLGWNQALEAGGVLVGKRVKLQLEVQAVQK